MPQVSAQMKKRTEIEDNDESRLFKDLSAITRDGLQLDLILEKIRQFAMDFGRRPRVLVSHTDRHTRKQIINRISAILAQWGFDVDIGPLQNTPGQIARMAQENDVHMIVLLCSQNSFYKEADELHQTLKKSGAEDIMVAVFEHAAENAMGHADQADRPGTSESMVFNPKSANDVIAVLDTLTRKK